LDDLGECAEERRLAPEDLPLGLGERPPRDAIDLRELHMSARTARPLEHEGVAHERRGIEIRAHRPGDDRLATRLTERAERDQLAVDREAGFLLKLTSGCRPLVLSLVDLTFRNRPRAFVLVCPVRATGMDEQHFQTPSAVTKRDDAGAALAHEGSRIVN